MKILVAQLKPKTGDLEYNSQLIKKYYDIALSQNVDVLLLPELMTSGYVCEDLFLHPAFIKDLQEYLSDLTKITKETVLLLSTPFYKDNNLYNGIMALQHGICTAYTTKKHLPNYGIFDEKRYFVEGKPQIIEINGIKIGIAICEDFWFSDVSKELKSQGAEILLVSNASPYEKNKFNLRIQKAEERFKDNNLPIIYCNQVGGRDGIVFDGKSFVYHNGIKHILASFIEDSCIVEIKLNSIPTLDINIKHLENKLIAQNFSQNIYLFTPIHSLPSHITTEEEIYSAIILGFRDYIQDNDFKSVLLGISGGIDSSLVGMIAADSIGASNVRLIMLPSEFTTHESIEDAQQLATNLGAEYQLISIVEILKSAKNTIPNISPIAYENLQARVRGMILMTLANSSNSLLIATSNKSESATGYATLYGDMCGGINPIKDLYKTDIYRIAKFRNENIPNLIDIKNPITSMIPARIFTKPPSAELAPNQRDSDFLPEYKLLDQILNLHIEQNLGVKEIVQLGFEYEVVKKVILLVKNSEFKRNQSTIGIKLSNCSFENDRRYPITNCYKP